MLTTVIRRPLMNSGFSRKQMLAAAAVFFVLVIAIIVGMSLTYRQDNKPATNSSANSDDTDDSNRIVYDSIKNTTKSIITNYDKVVANLPETRKISATRELLYTLLANGVSKKPKDAKIRASSYQQKLVDKNKIIVQTSYLIDIPSLNQTYRLTDTYSPVDENNPTNHATMITCPKKSQMISQSFQCVDQYSNGGSK